jgi:Na+/H+ antiporter NhaB
VRFFKPKSDYLSVPLISLLSSIILVTHFSSVVEPQLDPVLEEAGKELINITAILTLFFQICYSIIRKVK